MMKDMNFYKALSPPGRLAARAAAKVLAILLLLLGYGYFILYQPRAVEQSLSVKHGDLRLRLERYERKTADSSALEEELQQMQSMLGDLSALEIGSPSVWHHRMKAFMESVPPGVMLAQLSFDGSGLSITGSCSTDLEAAAFLNRLNRSGLCQHIRLERLSYGSQVAFEITGTLAYEQ